MSDSDDTNVLVQIPPDFFIADTSSTDGSDLELRQFNSFRDIRGIGPLNDSCATDYKHVDNQDESCRSQNIHPNLTLNSISPETYLYMKKVQRNLNAPSSGAGMYYSDQTSLAKFCHSTPKVQVTHENGTLREIDSFLEQQRAAEPFKCIEQLNSENARRERKSDRRAFVVDAIEKLEAYNMDSINSEPCPDLYRRDHRQPIRSLGAAFEDLEPLMSLKDIWGSDGQSENLTYKEEKIRRQHCEKTIQMLQTKILESQQKISVAIEVDQKKDAALAKLRETNSVLLTKINQFEQAHSNENYHIKEEKKKVEFENVDLKKQLQMLEKERYQATEMLKKFQERNEALEIKYESSTKTTNEIRDIHRRQLEDLEIRVSNYRKNEELMNAEMEKLKNHNKKLQADNEKTTKSMSEQKTTAQDAQKEIDQLKQQKQTVYDRLQDERTRGDNLDKSKKTLQQTVDAMREKMKTLEKELEHQRISLKSYYQTQLENVVAKKMSEFQKQLDTSEENLRTEAKNRERTIADRAIKQIELINEKNNEEFALINEKHNEEIQMYRIQLGNASRTINQLEEKLGAYQTRRADIAERLHNVMETQWQRALEIITSPSGGASAESGVTPPTRPIDTSKLDRDRADGVAGLYHNKAENEIFETPISNRLRRDNGGGGGSSSDRGSSEKLHQYIELLLKKSPRDLEQLDHILNMPKTSSSNQKSNGPLHKRDTSGHGKQPWK